MGSQWDLWLFFYHIHKWHELDNLARIIQAFVMIHIFVCLFEEYMISIIANHVDMYINILHFIMTCVCMLACVWVCDHMYHRVWSTFSNLFLDSTTFVSEIATWKCWPELIQHLYFSQHECENLRIFYSSVKRKVITLQVMPVWFVCIVITQAFYTIQFVFSYNYTSRVTRRCPGEVKEIIRWNKIGNDLSNVQNVCVKYTYLLDPSKDDVILFWKFSKDDAMMMMQWWCNMPRMMQ